MLRSRNTTVDLKQVTGQKVKKHYSKRSQTKLFDNRVLRRKTGRRSEEVSRQRRVLRNEELHHRVVGLILQTGDHSRQMK